MAATLTDQRFTGPEWTFERKLDGIRMLAFKRGRQVRLLSRNKLVLTEKYPAVAEALAALPVTNAIFDGEATWAWGRQGAADYYVFDVLWLNGKPTTDKPLVERRRLLAAIPFSWPVARVKPLRGDAPWTRACDEGWEPLGYRACGLTGSDPTSSCRSRLLNGRSTTNCVTRGCLVCASTNVRVTS